MRVLVLAAVVGLATALPVSPAKPSGTIAAHLRGVSAPADKKEVDKKEEKPLLKPSKTDERGPRGHFYYASGCEDCFYKGEQCGCQPAMEYFACLTKHCYKSNNSVFAEQCTAIGDKCATDININCRGKDTICDSKFSQLPVGGLGFSVDVDEDNAFCGPNGKCLGTIKLSANLHNAPKPKPAPQPKKVAAAPAPAAPAAPAKDEAAPHWLECGLPKTDHADIEHKEDWTICQTEVKADHGDCSLPMFHELEAGANKKAYCAITDGKGGKRLTQPHYTQVINIHQKPSTAVAAEKPKEEPKKVVPAEKPKQEPKKALGDAHKAPAPKPEAKKEQKVLADAHTKHQLPWMAEKEKRKAARNTEEAKKAIAENAAEEKAAKEAAAKKAAKGPKSESSLPWMEGKVSDKPPSPMAR